MFVLILLLSIKMPGSWRADLSLQKRGSSHLGCNFLCLFFPGGEIYIHSTHHLMVQSVCIQILPQGHHLLLFCLCKELPNVVFPWPSSERFKVSQKGKRSWGENSLGNAGFSRLCTAECWAFTALSVSYVSRCKLRWAVAPATRPITSHRAPWEVLLCSRLQVTP